MVTARDALVVLDDLRSSSGLLGRARILRKGYEVLQALTPGDRKDLMLALAGRAAPDAIDHIEARTGQEVDRTMVADALTMLARLEPGDITELTAELGDAESRADLLEDVAAAAGLAAASAAGIDLAPEVTFTTPEPVVVDLDADRPTDEPAHAPADDPGQAPVHELVHEVEPEVSGEQVEAAPADVDPAVTTDAANAPDPAPSFSVPVVDAPTPAPRSAPPARPRRVAAPGPAWIRELTDATDGGHAVRAFRRHLDEIAAASTSAQTDALLLVPDGWARRRCLDALVRTGAASATSVGALLVTLAAHRDRRLVAGALVADDPLLIDHLDGLLDEVSLVRMRRRTRRQVRAWM